MTILLLEGFEYWGTEANLEKLYDPTGDIISLSTSTVRTGTYSAELYYSSDYVSFPQNYGDTICVGVAFYAPSLGLPDQIMTIFANGNGYNYLFVGTSDTYVYVRGSATYYYSGVGCASGAWNYVEFKIYLNNTTGYVIVRLNGVEILNQTGIDTSYSADTEFVKVHIMGEFGGTGSCYIDDLYITDGEFLGPIKIYSFLPTSNGTHTDFTPSAGSNYQNVDETSPDDDTTYNEGDTLGNKDTYIITPTGLSGQTIKGVGVRQFLGKTGSLGLRANMITRVNSTDYQGSKDVLPGEGGYGVYHDYWQVNPDDSSPWEYSDLTSAEFGLEITGISTTT